MENEQKKFEEIQNLLIELLEERRQDFNSLVDAGKALVDLNMVVGSIIVENLRDSIFPDRKG